MVAAICRRLVLSVARRSHPCQVCVCVCVKLPLQLGLLLLAAQACACLSFGTLQILLLCPPFFTFRFCCVAGPLSVAPLPPSSAKPEWVSNQQTEHPARKAFRAFFLQRCTRRARIFPCEMASPCSVQTGCVDVQPSHLASEKNFAHSVVI